MPAIIGAQSITTGCEKIEAGVKFHAGEGGIGAGLCDFGKNCVWVKRGGTGSDQQVLAQNVARARATRVAIQIRGDHRLNRGVTFDDLPTIYLEYQCLIQGVVVMSETPNPLSQPFDVFGRPHLDDQLHIAPVAPLLSPHRRLV